MVMSFEPSERTTCAVRRPAEVEIAPGAFASLYSGTLLNCRTNLRLGAVPVVPQRTGSAIMFGCQSAHARAMMLLGTDLDGMNPAAAMFMGSVCGSAPKRRNPFGERLTLS